MNQIPNNVFLAVQSDRWRSTLEIRLSERCGRLRIRHAADLSECLKQTQEFQPEVVIVELSKDRLVEDCKAIFNVGQRLPNTLWVAVSDDNLTAWQPLLWVCGISDLCSNISRVENLISRFGSYLDTSRTRTLGTHGYVQPQTIEDRIVQSMPW